MKYLISIVVVFLISCAGSKEAVKKETAPTVNSKYDESFDPLTLNDDDIIIEPDDIAETGSQTNQSAENLQDENYIQEVNGFRIQILATDNIEKASLVEQEATDRFERKGHKTYLVFEAPLYKIRVGDCKDRSEAEQLREIAKSFGYNGAFIVKTKVITIQ